MADETKFAEEHLKETIERAIGAVAEEIGTLNVLICGMTGHGKSTLINSVFQGYLADTGMGEPVTQETKRHAKPGIPLAIYDTKGLEALRARKMLNELMKEIRRKSNDANVSNRIHVAWLCIAEDHSRVEKAHIVTHERLVEYAPMIGVITKARQDQGFLGKARDGLPLARSVLRVRAMRETLDDGHVIEPMGLVELVEATGRVIPPETLDALVAAQRVSLDMKVEAARNAVKKAAIKAAAIGAAPIPFSDAILLVPTQVHMLAKISSVFGLEVDQRRIATIIASVAGTTLATAIGKSMTRAALKVVPGANVAVSVISGAVASSLTYTIGNAFIAVLAKLYKDDGSPPEWDRIEQEIRQHMSTKDQHDPQETSGSV